MNTHLIVGRDLTPDAWALAEERGWEEHDAIRPEIAAQFEFEAIAQLLHRIADVQNDILDHDEYHAAGDVIVTCGGSAYISRWIEGLLERAGEQGQVKL